MTVIIINAICLGLEASPEYNNEYGTLLKEAKDRRGKKEGQAAENR